MPGAHTVQVPQSLLVVLLLAIAGSVIDDLFAYCSHTALLHIVAFPPGMHMSSPLVTAQQGVGRTGIGRTVPLWALPCSRQATHKDLHDDILHSNKHHSRQCTFKGDMVT